MTAEPNHASAGWHAPVADGPVSGAVRVPASKSETARILALAALADGPVTVRNPLQARDAALMVTALTSLGAEIDTSDAAEWIVRPGDLTGGSTVDCGLAGTVMRFVPPIAALATGATRFDGDPRAYERPMGGLLDGLAALGVAIDDDARRALPFTITGTGTVHGGRIAIDSSASSQFISGLLISAARFDDGLIVEHIGSEVPSIPHIDMTLEALSKFGVRGGRIANTTWQVEPGAISGNRTFVMEPDLSNASPFLAAALVTGGSVSIADWPSSSAQPGIEIVHLLHLMGARSSLSAQALTLTGSGSVNGISVDMSGVGELVPTIAAIATLADSPTKISGVAHLRGHETDRLAALTAEINGLGGDCEELSDGLLIRPRPLHAGVWHAYADHRMATAGAIIGLAVPGVVVDDIASTSKTMPGFAALWHDLVLGDVA